MTISSDNTQNSHSKTKTASTTERSNNNNSSNNSRQECGNMNLRQLHNNRNNITINLTHMKGLQGSPHFNLNTRCLCTVNPMQKLSRMLTKWDIFEFCITIRFK